MSRTRVNSTTYFHDNESLLSAIFSRLPDEIRGRSVQAFLGRANTPYAVSQSPRFIAPEMTLA
jgi:hypothetical protein